MNNQKPKPEGSEDICLHAGDIPPSCSGCEYYSNCTSLAKVDVLMPSQEPVAPLAKIVVDADKVFSSEEIKFRLRQPNTTDLQLQTVEKFREAIVRHIEINPTKGLDVCTATVIYLQFRLMPQEAQATYVIQLLADIFTAYEGLRASGIASKETTPLGLRLH